VRAFSELPDGPPAFIPIYSLLILDFLFFSSCFKYAWCFKVTSKTFCLLRSRTTLPILPHPKDCSPLDLFVVVSMQPSHPRCSCDEGVVATPIVFSPLMKDVG